MALFVDYLEGAAGHLRKKRKKLRELNKQYREVYDKQIREEMDRVRKDIRKKNAEIVEELYENSDELKHLKKYFPELLEVFMEDENIGGIIRKKSFLFENAKQMNEKEALGKLGAIRSKRRQLGDAKKFLHRWAGTISGRQLGATYPLLKGKIKGSIEKDEAVEIINGMNAELRKEGWAVLINSPLIVEPLQKLMAKEQMLHLQEMEKRRACGEARGRGTATEFNAKKKLENVERERRHNRNMIRHILLANHEFLSSLKKSRGWTRARKNPLEKIAEEIPVNRIKEKTWLEKMRKKLAV